MSAPRFHRATALALSLLLAASLPAVAPAASIPATPADLPSAAVCTPDPEPPEYYAIELVSTKNVPGTAFTDARADVTYAPTSPFGVSIAADGSYRYDVHVDLSDADPPRGGSYVAWVTTTQIDEIRRLGPLGEDGRVTGSVAWNKFLVVVTLEEDPQAAEQADAERWRGPVAFRGMSRSGMMHTMAGHGPFQVENCASYGFSG